MVCSSKTVLKVRALAENGSNCRASAEYPDLPITYRLFCDISVTVQDGNGVDLLR